MELGATQRKIVFALVVFALAGLGVYLFTSVGHGPGQAGAAPPGHPAQQQPSAPPPSSTPTATSPATAPVATSPAKAASGQTRVPDIYQWLPFDKRGLANAASVVVRFGDAYGTFSYTQNAAAYIAPMSKLITTDLAKQLSQAYSTPGVANMRTSRKQVSAGSASITSLRAFGSSSLTFVVTITQRISASNGATQNTTNYAVTAVGGDTSWQVNDIELASAGNF
jgi:hypothetical protein